MKKFYKIVLLLIVLIFLTTFNPNKINLIQTKNNEFFKIQTIDIMGNFLIKKNEISEKLNTIYNKNIFLINWVPECLEVTF